MDSLTGMTLGVARAFVDDFLDPNVPVDVIGVTPGDHLRGIA